MEVSIPDRERRLVVGLTPLLLRKYPLVKKPSGGVER